MDNSDWKITNLLFATFNINDKSIICFKYIFNVKVLSILIYFIKFQYEIIVKHVYA